MLTAIFANYLAPYDPTEILYTPSYELAADLRPGQDGFILGTTSLGRDVFSQIVYGTRSALLIGLTAAFMVALIGSIVGLVSGYFGGWIDALLMRLADIAFGIPFLPFVIVLAAFLKPSIWNVVIAMALVLWRDTARVIRSQVLTLRSRGYVDAARVAGSSDLQDHPAPHRSQHPAALVPVRIDRDRLGDPHRSIDLVPRVWRSGIDQLGLHATGCIREPGAREAGVLLVRSAGHLHHPGCLRRFLHHAGL